MVFPPIGGSPRRCPGARSSAREVARYPAGSMHRKESASHAGFVFLISGPFWISAVTMVSAAVEVASGK
jgi:hypothetical protein